MKGAVLPAAGDAVRRVGAAAVERGLPPAWVGYRWIRQETVREYFARHGRPPAGATLDVVHPECTARNPLPRNVRSRDDLPAQRGWWGYSFRDVPARTSGETLIATLPDCLVTWYRDAARSGDFYPAIVNGDGRALEMREIRFRPLHAQTLRRASGFSRIAQATWVTERVYHNYSHWLTAHLPKLLLLRERGEMADVLLPARRPRLVDDSLARLGIDPAALPTFGPDRPLKVDELSVLVTDRFRPELLRLVRAAAERGQQVVPHRRVLISRRTAARRRLVNEDALWARLAAAGFERVQMEDLSFDEQVALMQESLVLVGPHGAGLTNMIFCQPGTHVVEIADLSFPNPNFYALAAALDHHYWLVRGTAIGEGHPIDKDLHVAPVAVEDVIARVLGGA
jgi:hypothetical protein